MTQHHRLAVTSREAGNTNRQLVHPGALQGPRLGSRRVVGLAPIELDQARLDAPNSIPEDVDRNAVL